MFLENKKENQINKYEIVEFTKDFLIENIMGDQETSINIKVGKGDSLKLYFDTNKSNEEKLSIIGIRPVNVSVDENIKIQTGDTVDVSELWEADFVLDHPMIINQKELPFKIKDYL